MLAHVVDIIIPKIRRTKTCETKKKQKHILSYAQV